MVKNYTFLFLFALSGLKSILYAQEIRVFTSLDFDLNGPVKSCLVSTDYGKEEYNFNKNGLLTKSVTRHNDSDYDVTYYKYSGGELIEKRLENYRDNTFDSSTSIANFYEIDSIPNRKVIEKIVSYDKEFLDQYEYIYDLDGRLEQINRNNKDGIDKTDIEYNSLKGEDTKTFYLNGVILESVRTSKKKAKDKSVQKVVLTKKFLRGDPSTALEETFDLEGILVEKTIFYFNQKKKQFVPEETITYSYNTLGMISMEQIKKEGREETKEYIYQFDNGEDGNWIKQIITPDNTYKTRKITYYEVEEE